MLSIPRFFLYASQLPGVTSRGPAPRVTTHNRDLQGQCAGDYRALDCAFQGHASYRRVMRKCQKQSFVEASTVDHFAFADGPQGFDVVGHHPGKPDMGNRRNQVADKQKLFISSTEQRMQLAGSVSM